MSSQSDAMKRLLALEAQSRLDAQGPLLDDLAAASGVSTVEILAEAERIEAATGSLTYRERLAWIAADCGLTVDALEAEADQLLAPD